MTQSLPQTDEAASTTTTTTRREFLGTATAAACVACLMAAGSASAAATTAPAGASIDAGPVASFKADGVYDALAKSHKVLIVRDGKSIHASSALCTHRNALVQKTDKPNAPLRCPKHNSVFDANGIALSGPAKSSLPRFAIKVEAGRVLVDTGKSFEEKDWNDPAASVAV